MLNQCKHCLLALVATALIAAAPGTAYGQKLLKSYVQTAKTKQAHKKSAATKPRKTVQSSRVPRRQSRSLKSRMVRNAQSKKKLHRVEKHVLKNLGGGVHGLFIKSDLLPGHYDRYLLFSTDSAGRARMLEPEKVLGTLSKKLDHKELVSLWRQTVAVVKEKGYKKDSTLRVQVDTELRILEKELLRRARKSDDTPVPWNPKRRDAVKELSKVGNGRQLAGALAKGRPVERRTLEMLEQGSYSVYSVENLPRSEFKTLITHDDMKHIPAIRSAKMSDYKQLKKKNSPLRKAIESEIAGFQFGKQRSVLIMPQAFREKVQTIVHEFNHGANRIPDKATYGKKETLAFEFTAFASEKSLNKGQLQSLKERIIRDYMLGGTTPTVVPDKPRGIRDNWVPKFPRGHEKSYLDHYYGLTAR